MEKMTTIVQPQNVHTVITKDGYPLFGGVRSVVVEYVINAVFRMKMEKFTVRSVGNFKQ